MAEVYKNSNAPISTKIFYGGEIVDADSTVLVQLYDVTDPSESTDPYNPGIPVGIYTATKVETDTGSYKLNIPFTLTTVDRKFRAHWIYQYQSQELMHYTFVDVVTPYCNIIEAIEDLNMGSDQSDPNYKTYHEIVMAEKYARKIIDDYTGQNFTLYTDTETVYGSGSDILPTSYKLHTLEKLYANDILLIDNINQVNNIGYDLQVSESGFGIRLNKNNLVDNTVYVANGMVPPSLDGEGFFNKNTTYILQGKFGWYRVPDEVEQACIQLMGHFFDKDRHWKDQYVKSIQTFDWKIDYSSDIHSGTGCAYADKLLSPYVLNQMVVI